MISELQWQSLEQATVGEPGAAWTRIQAEGPHDLYIAVLQPGQQRSIWYDFPAAVFSLDEAAPKLRSVRVTFRPRDEDADVIRCQVTLESPDLNEVFGSLASDVITAIGVTLDDEAGVNALFTRLNRWRRLLESEQAAGLSRQERRGLFGELFVFEKLIDSGVPLRSAVAAWTGPLYRHQDFQGPAAIEVKATTAKQPQALLVTSERELDRTGVPELYLAHISIDERRGGTGDSLQDIVTRLRARLALDTGAVEMFEQLLAMAGYLPYQWELYLEPHYSLRSESYYSVTENFPCIVESMLPTGVGDVSYRVQISALSPYSTDWSVVLRAMRGA
jgi:Putative  PD-(D/E)XK family member, (DUF4420)